MKILPSYADPLEHEHINRFYDVGADTLYLVETLADYDALPASIKESLGEQFESLKSGQAQ